MHCFLDCLPVRHSGCRTCRTGPHALSRRHYPQCPPPWPGRSCTGYPYEPVCPSRCWCMSTRSWTIWHQRTLVTCRRPIAGTLAWDSCMRSCSHCNTLFRLRCWTDRLLMWLTPDCGMSCDCPSDSSPRSLPSRELWKLICSGTAINIYTCSDCLHSLSMAHHMDICNYSWTIRSSLYVCLYGQFYYVVHSMIRLSEHSVLRILMNEWMNEWMN